MKAAKEGMIRPDELFECLRSHLGRISIRNGGFLLRDVVKSAFRPARSNGRLAAGAPRPAAGN